MPHVNAWWDRDIQWTPELVDRKYGQYVRGFKSVNLDGQVLEKPMYAYIVCIEGTEIGYIQYYNVYDFPREQADDFTGLPENMGGLDVFIGESTFLGRGLGPLIIREFLEQHVFVHFAAAFVDPDTANVIAIRTYEKAGFRIIRKTADEKVTWMVRNKPNDFQG